MSRLLFILTCVCLLATGSQAYCAEPALTARTFLNTHCLDCHTGKEAEGGLDLEKLSTDLSNAHTASRWVRIYDRVAAGEMPPADYGSLEAKTQQTFLDQTGNWISQTQQAQYASQGRVKARRLTNLQLERTLHDLLGIDIPLASHFPEEMRTNGYNTVADGQPMSHFQMEQHLEVVDLALEEAFRRAFNKTEDTLDKFLDAEGLSRTNPKRRCREPEVIDNHGVVWSSGLTFYGRIPATTAKADGWYRFTIRAKSLKAPEDHGVWCTVRRGQCVSSAPLYGWVGAFEALPETQQWTYETWLPRGEMIEIRPGDVTLKKGRFAGGQVGTGEGDPQDVPGVAIESIRMERIHLGMTDSEIRQTLLGAFTPEQASKAAKKSGDTVSSELKAEVSRLIEHFALPAFRRPVEKADIQPYLSFALDSLQRGETIANALKGGYRALLCSPRFLYFQEQPGPLDDYAIASRLSYFLWSRMPDQQLLNLAASGKLQDRTVLRQQVERMLAHEYGKTFVRDFAEQWLDLNLIDFTEPDRRLYGSFDIIVQQAMLEETNQFLQTLLDKNMSVKNLIDSDFTFLNSRLARFYKIDKVEGDQIQQVSLSADSPRGGLLGQGSILKVTANGTTTSPVIRGVWISERLLGVEIPPPPTSVAAIEPDIRGAKSIREQLEKHKSSDACASCHRYIDPPGFALENFDPAGGWRETYGGKKGARVDPSYEMVDGRKFQDVNEFRKHLLEHPESLAENMVNHLLTYGTGSPIQFTDRQEVHRIVDQTADKDYGLRSLIAEAVCSQIFLTK